MKLYVYDHCPFCVRARMIFGLKNLPVELVVLANDDEATPIGLVGKKVVPILVKEDGTAMPEVWISCIMSMNILVKKSYLNMFVLKLKHG